MRVVETLSLLGTQAEPNLCDGYCSLHGKLEDVFGHLSKTGYLVIDLSTTDRSTVQATWVDKTTHKTEVDSDTDLTSPIVVEGSVPEEVDGIRSIRWDLVPYWQKP